MAEGGGENKQKDDLLTCVALKQVKSRNSKKVRTVPIMNTCVCGVHGVCVLVNAI